MTPTRYPNIPVGLPSEPVGLSLSGYESFEPAIGLVGLIPTPPVPTTIVIPPFEAGENITRLTLGWVIDRSFTPVAQ